MPDRYKRKRRGNPDEVESPHMDSGRDRRRSSRDEVESPHMDSRKKKPKKKRLAPKREYLNQESGHFYGDGRPKPRTGSAPKAKPKKHPKVDFSSGPHNPDMGEMSTESKPAEKELTPFQKQMAEMKRKRAARRKRTQDQIAKNRAKQAGRRKKTSAQVKKNKAKRKSEYQKFSEVYERTVGRKMRGKSGA